MYGYGTYGGGGFGNLFARSGATLTPITATRQVVAGVRAGVVGTRQVVASVRASAQGNRQVVSSVRAPAIGTRQIKANTLLGLTGSRQIQTTVCLDLSATRSLSASVRAGVSASRSIVASVRYGVRATCKVVVKIEGFAIVKTGATLDLSSPLSELLLSADVCGLEMVFESTELIFDTEDMKTFTTDPYLEFTLKVDGDAPDFTGKTIIIVGSINGAVMFRKTAEITDAQAGKVRIRLDDAEIDTVGKMLIVAHMKDVATGRNTPFPSDGYVIVPVEDSLVKP